MGDFWQVLYGAENLVEDGDEDGDGASNGEESAAGTDPFDLESVLRARLIEVQRGMSTVTWRSIDLWEYQLQSAAEGSDVM